MVGLFDTPAASNYKASNVWDVIPSDVVANVILAASAALGQGFAARCHVSPTRIYPAAQQEGSFRTSQPGFEPQALQKVPLEATEKKQGLAGPLMIIHCGSSTTYPLTIMESWNWGVEIYGAWWVYTICHHSICVPAALSPAPCIDQQQIISWCQTLLRLSTLLPWSTWLQTTCTAPAAPTTNELPQSAASIHSHAYLYV
jgi:hypothetical protein